MFKLFILLIMVYLHVADDFNQGILADMKQRSFWESLEYDEKFRKLLHLKSRKTWKFYINDWIPALLLHSMKWSISIHIPLIVYVIYVYDIKCDNPIFIGIFASVIVQAIIHAITDHFKCNLYKINLICDQTIHMIQILVVFLIFTL